MGLSRVNGWPFRREESSLDLELQEALQSLGYVSLSMYTVLDVIHVGVRWGGKTGIDLMEKSIPES